MHPHQLLVQILMRSNSLKLITIKKAPSGAFFISILLSMIIEILCYLLVLKLFLFFGTAFFRNISIIRYFTLIAFIIACIIGQILKDHRTYYPLINWTMYSSPYPSSFYDEFVIVTDSGEFQYPFSIITKTSPRAFMSKQSSILNLASSNSVDKTLEKNLEALITIYCKHFPEQSVKRFKINAVQLEIGLKNKSNLVRHNYFTFDNENVSK